MFSKAWGFHFHCVKYLSWLFYCTFGTRKSLSKSFSLYSWIQAVVYTQTTNLTTDMNDQQSQPEVGLSVSSGTTVLVPVGVWLEFESALPKKRADYYKSCEVLEKFRLESDYINLHDVLLKKMTERSFSCESNPLGSHSKKKTYCTLLLLLYAQPFWNVSMFTKLIVLRSEACSDWPAIQCVVIGRIPQAWDGNVTPLTVLWCRVPVRRD